MEPQHAYYTKFHYGLCDSEKVSGVSREQIRLLIEKVAQAVLVNVANVKVLPIANTQYLIGIGNIGTGYWQHWQQLPPPETEIVAHL